MLIRDGGQIGSQFWEISEGKKPQDLLEQLGKIKMRSLGWDWKTWLRSRTRGACSWEGKEEAGYSLEEKVGPRSSFNVLTFPCVPLPSQSGLCPQRLEPWLLHSLMLLGDPILDEYMAWNTIERKTIKKCTKLKGSEQRNEGCKNLRISWAPYHHQAPEEVASGKQGPHQGTATAAGNTLRRADSLQATGGLTTQSEPAPVVQEPAGRMLSTRATQHHSIGLPWPKTLSRTLSHSHSIWAPSRGSEDRNDCSTKCYWICRRVWPWNVLRCPAQMSWDARQRVHPMRFADVIV